MAKTTDRSGVNWGSAIVAGLVATVVITITLWLSGTNILMALGGMMLGAGASTTSQYILGGLIHLAVGIFYGIVYAALVAPVTGWNTLKGAVFGLASKSSLRDHIHPLGASLRVGPLRYEVSQGVR